MKKTFPLTQAGRHPDRVLDALKHEIRKYLKRERAKPLAEGVEFLDFDCRVGPTEDSAESTPVSELTRQIDAAVSQGASHVYVEILAKPGVRPPRPATADTDAQTQSDESVDPAPSTEGNDQQS